MTAIAGIAHADLDRPVGEEPCASLARRLGRNSGHPARSWTAGPVCLVQSAGEGPRHPGPQPVRIVADARLDDRGALAATLGLPPTSGDLDLLAAAYGRWGTDCPVHLVGDFAFAIWDEARGRLLLVRDQMGVRPLYVRVDETGLRFASRPSLLLTGDEALDEGRIAAYLLGIDDDEADTVFAAIRRLPAGHWLSFEAGELAIRRYWSLAPEDVAADADFAAGLRERLICAVDDRLRGPGPMAAMLSGGLDSSAIVSAAAFSRRGDPDFRLATYSFAYSRAPELDESRFGQAVLDQYGLEGHGVPMDDLAPLAPPFDLVDGHDELVYAPGLPKIARLLGAAAADGAAVVLDGHGGDEVVSHGYGRLNELARAGRWLALYRELHGIGYMFGEDPRRVFIQYFAARGIGRRLHGAYRRLRPAPPSAQGSDPLLLLDPGFVARGGIADRYRAWTERYQRAAATERGLHAWNIAGPAAVRALEALARAGDRMGCEVRFPFFDRRLVSFALAVPEDQKLRDGWTRSVLRRAMDGILPTEVQWRRTKIDFGGELARGLARHHRDVLARAAQPAGLLGGIVDATALHRRLEAFLADPGATPAVDLFALWRAAALTLWLEDRRGRAAERDAA